jgi:GST-like protein
LAKGLLYSAGQFLDVESYEHVQRWANLISERPAAKRGRQVNKAWGDADKQLLERHSSTDFDKINWR